MSNDLLEETGFNCAFHMVSAVSEKDLAGIAMNSSFRHCMLHHYLCISLLFVSLVVLRFAQLLNALQQKLSQTEVNQ